MKNLKLFLLPLLLLLSGGFTATQQTVLFSGGCPTIGGACPSINLNFTTGKYWVNGVGFVPLTSVVSTTRASSKICANAAGVFTSVGNNILCVTDQGALIEEARTNKSTNYNANPPALVTMGTAAAFNAAVTNTIAVGGDASTLFGVVDDTSNVVSAGYGNIANGRVYKIDNSAGAASAFLDAAGAFGNLNTSTLSVVARGDVFSLQDNFAGINVPMGASTTYVRRVATGTPGNTAARFRVSVGAGKIVYVFFQQNEEGPFVTSPIVTAGASATRAADVPQLIGPALVAGQASKSAFFQTSSVALSSASRNLLSAANANEGFIYYPGGSNTTVINQYNFITASNATFGSGTVAGTVKSAHSYDASSLTAVANGGSKATSANSGNWNTSAIYLGNRFAGDRALNGYMQRFALSPVKGVFDGATAP